MLAWYKKYAYLCNVKNHIRGMKAATTSGIFHVTERARGQHLITSSEPYRAGVPRNMRKHPKV